MNDTDFGFSNDFEDFVNELENKEQPSCNLENPEECEACGSSMGRKNNRGRDNHSCTSCLVVRSIT